MLVFWVKWPFAKSSEFEVFLINDVLLLLNLTGAEEVDSWKTLSS